MGPCDFKTLLIIKALTLGLWNLHNSKSSCCNISMVSDVVKSVSQCIFSCCLSGTVILLRIVIDCIVKNQGGFYW